MKNDTPFRSTRTGRDHAPSPYVSLTQSRIGTQRSSWSLTSRQGFSSWKQMVSVSRYLRSAETTSCRFLAFGADELGAEGSEGESERASSAREASDVCPNGETVAKKLQGQPRSFSSASFE